MNNNFFNKINYSACNEDSESERQALQLTTEDVVLCITGSGARPLDLLIDHPQKIISVDFNAAQNHLLSLKIAAYHALTYEEFCEFLGLQVSSDRQKVFEKLKPRLSEAQKVYWEKNYQLIEQGVLYCGTWEKLLLGMNKMAFFRKGLIQQLFSAKNIEEQREIWNNQWKNTTWKLFLKLITNRFLWTKIIREPGALLIPESFDLYKYMNERLDYLANHHLLKTNHFANLMFLGEYKPACNLPLHLRKKHFETIKSRVENIEIVTDSLINVFNDQSIMSKISAFSLSDFSSYSTESDYQEIWKRLLNHATTGAKFCERFFLVKRNPEHFSSKIQRDSSLEIQLMETDQTALYSFAVGKIN
jgi:S-adenosylmethionine-diacylglycerol 3-amino-3-carboxypropyl transferase